MKGAGFEACPFKIYIYTSLNFVGIFGYNYSIPF